MNETSAPDYRYWAFLSYSSKDAALSRKLHHRLETYTIPRDLVGRPGRDGPVPKKLFPCFRDRDELPLSSDLGGSIEEALRASRYLIVICTPRSAKSRWVNEEVRFFKSLGRDDCILAIIAGGEPNVTDQPGKQEMECFCPALRYEVDEHGQLTRERAEPIAGDLRPGGDGWTNAFLKAVAGITGLGFNAFVQREVKRRRRQQVLLGALVLLCLCAALWWWDYIRVKVAYYQDIATCWSVPEGIDKLTANQTQHRQKSYRLESSRRKVRRVTAINGSGYPVDDPGKNNASTEEIHYRENGDLDFITYLNHNGREVFRETYSDLRDNGSGGMRHYVDFKLHDQYAPAAQADTFSLLGVRQRNDQLGEFSRTKTNIAGEILDYTSSGRTSRIQYRDSSAIPLANSEGIYAQGLEYNSIGQKTKITNLGSDGKPLPDESGVVDLVWTYDAFGNEIEEDYFGVGGRPIIGKCGYAKVKIKYDEHGNDIEWAFFDVDGQPVLYHEEGQAGFAKETVKWDERGNQIALAYFGIDGRPIARTDSVAAWECQYDGRGNKIEQAAFGVDGKLVSDIYNIAKWTARYDQTDKIIEKDYFGVDGKLVLRREGWAKETYKYDAHDNIIEFAVFGVDGKPVLNQPGFAKETFNYDERGNIIEIAYFGPNGQPVLLNWGFAKMTFKYDARGNDIERDTFGIDGRQNLGVWGYAKWTAEYDEHGQQIEEAYFGLDGQPMLSHDGYAKWTGKYDERGNKIEEDYLGVDGQPIDVKGACRIVCSYDATGKAIKTERFNASGKLVP